MVYLPTLLVCAVFYWWSRATQVGWLGRLLRTSSLVCAMYFLILIMLVAIAANTCDGNILKGLSNCRLFPDLLSRFVVGLGYISYALAILWALILVGAGGLVEALRPTPRD